MRVYLKNVTKTQGLIFPETFYGIEVRVIFTELEKAIIKQRNLGLVEFLKRNTSADKNEDIGYFNLRVGDLRRGPNTHYFYDLGEANLYAEQIKEALLQLRYLIDQNDVEAGELIFEV